MPSPPKKKNPAAPSPTQKGGAAAVSKVSQKMPAAKAADKEPLLAEHGAARSSGSPAAKSPSASPAAQRAGASPAAARSGDDGSSPVASSPAAPPPDKTTYLRAINWVYDLFECDFGHDGPSRNGETRSRSPCMCFCSLLVVLVFILVAMSAARLGIDGVQSAVSASSVFIVGLIDSETVASLRARTARAYRRVARTPMLKHTHAHTPCALGMTGSLTCWPACVIASVRRPVVPGGCGRRRGDVPRRPHRAGAGGLAREHAHHPQYPLLAVLRRLDRRRPFHGGD